MPEAPVVLDSYALLAYFRGESNAVQVRALLDKAAADDLPLRMTDVSYAEVKYTLLKKDGEEAWEEASKILESLPIEFHSTTRALADSAAEFKARFKISLADAFSAALAQQEKAELVTGDPEFRALERAIDISWLKGAR